MNKIHKKYMVPALALLMAGLWVGCGETEKLSPITTGVSISKESSAELEKFATDEKPVIDEKPATDVKLSMTESGEETSQAEESITEPEPTTPDSAASPEPTTPPESSVTEEPTETPAPYDPTADGYPALKADGRGWGLAYRETGLQPWGNETPKNLAAYNAYYVGDANENVIYLTFDCGYENGNTDAILTALKNHDVKATFFVTGHFLETEGELTKRMVEEGHTVGNHSYNHPDITKLDEAAFQEELNAIKKKFNEVTGAELSMYFRPPEGKCYSQTLKWSKDMGYATILWSLAHVDWYTDNQPKPEDAIATLTKRIHPGAVVLLHNISQTNGEILDQLITKWEEMGYTIKPLSDLVGW